MLHDYVWNQLLSTFKNWQCHLLFWQSMKMNNRFVCWRCDDVLDREILWIYDLDRIRFMLFVVLRVWISSFCVEHMRISAILHARLCVASSHLDFRRFDHLLKKRETWWDDEMMRWWDDEEWDDKKDATEMKILKMLARTDKKAANKRARDQSSNKKRVECPPNRREVSLYPKESVPVIKEVSFYSYSYYKICYYNSFFSLHKSWI